MSELGRKAVRSLGWATLENLSVAGIGLAVSIVLARVLTPRQFGQVAMLQVFVVLGQALSETGLTQALVREQKPNEAVRFSAFLVNITIAVASYVILWVCASWIARFFGDTTLCPLMRGMGLSIPLAALGLVQTARLTAEMQFGRLWGISTVSVLVSSAVGLWMAFTGRGVWALVGQQVSMWGTRAVLLWAVCGWQGRARWSWTALRPLLSFGWPLMFSAMLNAVWNNIYAPLIGRFLTVRGAGLYWRADTLTAFGPRAVGDVAGRVSYPLFCKMQSNESRDDTPRAFRRMCVLTLCVTLPFCALLCIFAPQIVHVLLGERWMACVPYIRILCGMYCLYPIHLLCVQLLNVHGRTGLFLRLELIKKGLCIAMLFICLPHGVTALCWGLTATGVLALALNLGAVRRYIKKDTTCM